MKKRSKDIIEKLGVILRYIYPEQEKLILELYHMLKNAPDSDEKAVGQLYYGRILDKQGKYDEALALYNKALEQLIRGENNEREIECLIRIGYNIGYSHDRYDQGLKIFYEAHNKSIKYKHRFYEGIILGYIGTMHERKEDFVQALSYYDQAIDLIKETNRKDEVALLYCFKGMVYQQINNFPKALKYFYKSLKILEEEADNEYFLRNTYNNFAGLLSAIGENEKAVNYYERSFDLIRNTPDAFSEGAALHNLGWIYGNILKNFDKGKEFNLKAIKKWRELGVRSRLCTVLTNMANILLEEHDTEAAYPCLVEAKDISEDLNLKEDHLYVMTNLAEYYIQKYELVIAEKILLDNCNNYLGTGLEHNLINSIEKLYKLYKQLDNAEKAFKYYEEFIRLSSKVKNEEAAKKLISIEFSYDLEKKEKEAEIERLKNVELKKAYEGLKIAQDELIRKERMAAIGKIASEIAHEVQNPLNFVNNFSEVNTELFIEFAQEVRRNGFTIEADELLNSILKNSESITTNGKRASGIISRLLELTRKGEII